MPFPMKIATIAGRGLGVVTTHALKPGQLILREHPLVRVDKTPVTPEGRANPVCIGFMNQVFASVKTGEFDPQSDFDAWPREVVKCFEGILDEQARIAYETLNKEKRRAWMDLCDVHAKDESSKTPGGIVRTNAVDDDDNRANLYEAFSRINHGCAPNAHRMAVDDKGGVAVVANKDIDMGEEVLVNYMDGADDGRPVEVRRERLMKQYHFRCNCSLCTEQEK